MRFKLLVALVDDHVTAAVTEAAREAGATGCTVVSSARGEVKWRNMRRALDAILTRAEHHAIEVAVAVLPVHYQYDPSRHAADDLAVRTGTVVRETWLTSQSDVEARLSAWAMARGIPFLSLTEAFRSANGHARLNFPLDGHWTPAGHAVAARALGRWLRSGRAFSFMPPAGDSAPLSRAAPDPRAAPRHKDPDPRPGVGRRLAPDRALTPGA